MKKIITILLYLVIGNLCSSQSLLEDRIYATQFRGEIYLDDQLNTKVKKKHNSTLYIRESNDNNQITRELIRLSDSTFLYTEYYPMSFETYFKWGGNYGIHKEGILIISNETIIDSSTMWNPEIFEVYPSPRKRNVLKQTGEWIEKDSNTHKKIKGSYNANGKHGEWNFHTSKGNLDKVVTFANGELIKEEYHNLLNYKSIEKSIDIIQKTWAVQSRLNRLISDFKKSASTYTFQKDGIFIKKFYRDNKLVYTRKGTWIMLDFETIEFTVYNKKEILKLEYLSSGQIQYKN